MSDCETVNVYWIAITCSTSPKTRFRQEELGRTIFVSAAATPICTFSPFPVDH
jgi:hypothetical protein